MGGMDIDDELWTSERVGYELNPDAPLTPGSVRSAMKRGGVRAVHGYWRSHVEALIRLRRGRGYRTDLKD